MSRPVAARMIISGDVDVMIAGGAEATITNLGVGGFTALKALSTARNDEPTKASRPFDRMRNGFVLGEGAGIVVLESLGFEYDLYPGDEVWDGWNFLMDEFQVSGYDVIFINCGVA